MSPRLLLLAATALLSGTAFAGEDRACCEKPASRAALLTSKGSEAKPTEGCDEPLSEPTKLPLLPLLSLGLGGAAMAVGAFCVRRPRRG